MHDIHNDSIKNIKKVGLMSIEARHTFAPAPE